jgi:hypothetical protein
MDFSWNSRSTVCLLTLVDDGWDRMAVGLEKQPAAGSRLRLRVSRFLGVDHASAHACPVLCVDRG